MITQRLGQLDRRLSLGLKREQRLAADALDDAVREPTIGVVIDLLLVRVDNLKLHGGGTAVENQYVHGI